MTLGLLALVVTTGALGAVMPPPTAHILGSATFGVGFVFLTVGRAQLFAENFLIPVAVLSGHATKRSVVPAAAVSAVLGGAVITVFTWLAEPPIAVVGNVAGGVLLVAFVRSVQAR